MLPYGLEDGLSVLGRLQSDLLADDVSVFPLHTPASFRLRLHAQHLVLVPQLHLVLDSRCGNTRKSRSDDGEHECQLFRMTPVGLTSPYGFLLLYRFFLFAQVLLVQQLLGGKGGRVRQTRFWEESERLRFREESEGSLRI